MTQQLGDGRAIVIAGSIAQRPERGGHAAAFLNYLLGFRHLGWKVTFLDVLTPEMAEADEAASPAGAAYLAAVMDGAGLADAYALYGDGDAGELRPVAGLAHEEVVRRVEESDLLLNVMGFFREDDVFAAAPRRVFLDIDPGFGQMWAELGHADVFAGHDAFVTVGENIGRDGCRVPTLGLDWLPTPQPIVLDLWPPSHGGDAWTSVATWRGPFDPIEYGGTTYGLRVHEFRKLAPLTRLVDASFELALEIDPADAADVALLEEHGWKLLEPRAVCPDPLAYGDFVRASRGELGVAKGLYVDTRGGWLSDRSIAYLASGKPVVAQDTGFSANYPTGEGLIAFSSLDEAVAGVEAVEAAYDDHARAARALAEEFFDSDKVLTRLIDRLGVA